MYFVSGIIAIKAKTRLNKPKIKKKKIRSQLSKNFLLQTGPFCAICNNCGFPWHSIPYIHTMKINPCNICCSALPLSSYCRLLVNWFDRTKYFRSSVIKNVQWLNKTLVNNTIECKKWMKVLFNHSWKCQFVVLHCHCQKRWMFNWMLNTLEINIMRFKKLSAVTPRETM